MKNILGHPEKRTKRVKIRVRKCYIHVQLGRFNVKVYYVCVNKWMRITWKVKLTYGSAGK